MQHSRFSAWAHFVVYNIIFLSGNLCTRIQLISERGHAWHLSLHVSLNTKIVLFGLEYKPCRHEDQRSSPQNVSKGWMPSMSICSPDALMQWRQDGCWKLAGLVVCCLQWKTAKPLFLKQGRSKGSTPEVIFWLPPWNIWACISSTTPPHPQIYSSFCQSLKLLNKKMRHFILLKLDSTSNLYSFLLRLKHAEISGNSSLFYQFIVISKWTVVSQ